MHTLEQFKLTETSYEKQWKPENRNNTFKVLKIKKKIKKQKNFLPRIVYSAKLLFKNEGKIKTFSNIVTDLKYKKC